MTLSRREFLAGSLATGALGLMPGGLWPKAVRLDGKETGQDKWIPTLCTLCPGGCGILARVYRKRVIGLRGNPMHPVNQGGLCPRGIAGIHSLYDPDRIQGPLRRNRATGRWEKISWDDALARVGEKLAELRAQGEPHRLVAMVGRVEGTLRSLIERFLRAYGSPNLVDFEARSRVDPALFLMQGVRAQPVYDIARSAFILSLNSDFLDAWESPVHMMRAYGAFRSETDKRRGRLIHVGPRLSMTAAKADEWVPVRPGTEGAFALGVAHVLLKERLYDEEFVAAHTAHVFDGTDDDGKAREGFATAVLRNYSPVEMSAATGAPAETIVRVAREFARAKPAVALPGHPSGTHSQGVRTRMAIHALNALAGSIDVPGGVLIPRPAPDLEPGVEPDATARKGLAMAPLWGDAANKLPLRLDTTEAILAGGKEGGAYKPRVALLFEANPVYSSPRGPEFARMLSEMEMMVSFSSFMDESTQGADYVLPNHVYLERWGDVPASTSDGISLIGLQQPAMNPFFDTRHSGDVLLALARGLGDPFPETFPEAKFKDLVQRRFRKVYESPQGDVFGPRHEAAWTRLLERSGWKSSAHESFEDFWKAVLDRGGWWDPIYYHQEWNRVFRTPGGRFDFAPDGMASTSPAGDRETDPRLPGYEPPPARSASPYPFSLILYTPLAFHGAGDSNLPWIQDISGLHVNHAWGTWVEIHPQDAGRLGIQTGDAVTVESPRGRIVATARIFQGAMPGVVAVPVGMGRRAHGRWQREVGADPIRIVDHVADPITGETVWNTTRVRISKGGA